jgi:holin-like protein
MMQALTLLLLLQLIGELLVRLLGLPLPGALLGMLLLLGGLLRLGRISDSLQQVCHFLLQNLTLLLIPFIAGIMAQFDRLDQQWLPFLAACVGGASLSLLASAWTLRWMLRRQAARARCAGRPAAAEAELDA